MKDINNPSDTDTDSTRSLSDSEHDSLESPDRFFKPAPTERRLQRRDALEAEAITERLRAIHQEIEANKKRIQEMTVTLLALQAERRDLESKIPQEAEMLQQIKKQKEEENNALNVKIETEEKTIKPLIKQVFEETEKISFLASLWRAVYTAIYHVLGLKTNYEILIERTNELALSIQKNKETIKANINDITEQTKTVSLNAKDYRIRGNRIDEESSACLGEKKLLKANNMALKEEEEELIQQLSEFKKTSEASSQAIDKMIESCDTLAKPTMLSKIQRTKTTPNAQVIVAQALSEFLKKPTETTQAVLAASMQDNPTYTDEPKLQKLLAEAKGYYTEVDEMLKSNEARPNM